MLTHVLKKGFTVKISFTFLQIAKSPCRLESVVFVWMDYSYSTGYYPLQKDLCTKQREIAFFLQV
jgi:hypothetical protein